MKKLPQIQVLHTTGENKPERAQLDKWQLTIDRLAGTKWKVSELLMQR